MRLRVVLSVLAFLVVSAGSGPAAQEKRPPSTPVPAAVRDACEMAYAIAAATPGTSVRRSSGPFRDETLQAPVAGCGLSISGSFARARSTGDAATRLRQGFEARGWQEMPAYSADGTDGTSFAFRNGTVGCLVRGTWDGGAVGDPGLPAEDWYKVVAFCTSPAFPEDRATAGGSSIGPALGAPRAQAPPALPFESPGACPFECCTYRAWTVKADTAILAERRDGAPVRFTVKQGEQVTGVTGVVVTTRWGRAVATRARTVGQRKIQVEAGEGLLLLHYLGEGFWKYWLRGGFDEDFLPDPENCQRSAARSSKMFAECAVQAREIPRTTWWVQVRNARGQKGWTRQVDRFSGMDACGGEGGSTESVTDG
jgi:hypothetical protein